MPAWRSAGANASWVLTALLLQRFAEYFLIGTLLSISIAILGGVIRQGAFYGHYTLPA